MAGGGAIPPPVCSRVVYALSVDMRNDGLVVRGFWRDDPDRLKSDRRRGGRNVLPRQGVDRPEFERDLPIEGPGEIGERAECHFHLTRQLTIDVRALAF